MKKENLNRTIPNNEIKSAIITVPRIKSPVLDGFTGEFYRSFNKELTTILLKVFQKLQEEGRLPT